MPGLTPLCPYCKRELAEMHARLREAHGRVDHIVALCDGCGEPLLWMEGGFRKPTDTEHIDIHEQPLVRAAREAWIEAHKLRAAGDQPTLARSWAEIRASLERDRIHLQNFRDNDQLYGLLKCVFMKGAEAWANSLVKAGKDKGPDAFAAQMILLHAELESFWEVYKEEVNADD